MRRLIPLADIVSSGSPRTRSRGRHWPWALAGAGLVANGLRLRSRVARLGILNPETSLHLVGPGRATAAAGRLSGPDPEHGLLTAKGVEVDDETIDAAVRYARSHDLDVLDLVPGDLHLERLYELVRLVDPKTYRHDRLAAGRGAGHATLVRTALLQKLSLRPNRSLDPVEYVEAMLQLKRYAPATTDLVVAPRLKSVLPDAAWRVPRLRALHGSTTPIFVAAPAVRAALLSAGPVVGRGKGLAALAAFLAQPFLVTAGGPVKPRDLRVGSALRRTAHDLGVAFGSLRLPPPPEVRHRAELAAADDETRRLQYARLMERSAAFLEPRVDACRWCASPDIHLLLEVPDLMQRKPGKFRLDECRACGHIFQNPRLSIEGLNFYYRDFYDGLGDESTAFVFSMGSRSYEGRAAMLEGAATPKRWLDVGAGHGHFCLVAKGMWPETAFDGLDLSDSVIDAERRGWIERAYKGLFPDLAPELTGAYDVVSMHHYLEHTREPGAELDAARTVLEEGGHLLIEVPDPDSRLGRALGWTWVSWFQPQHQHFVSVDNLTRALEDRDFTVVKVERGPAHQAIDLAFCFWLLANRIAPGGDKPWLPRPTLARRLGQAATWTAVTPLLAGALLTDQALALILRRLPKMTNTYRLLARRD